MNFNYIESLVTKAKNGDVSAKEIIFEEFRPMILNLSKRTFVHGYDFSDIEHECYATLLKCIKIYDLDKKRFVGYATMAIKNNINYLIKKSCKRSSSEGSEALILTDTLEHVLPSNNELVDVQVTDTILAESLYKYINKLPQQHKDILNFTIINNGSLKEYSKNNNINYPTTVNIKNRALNQLRKQILLWEKL